MSGDLATMVLAALFAPFIVLPGLVLGWLTRAWWQAVAAALLLGTLVIPVVVWSKGETDPRYLLQIAPSAIVGSLIWTQAEFRIGRWLRRRRGKDRVDTSRRVGGAVLGLFVGAIGGGLLGALFGNLYVTATHVSDFEGGAGYAVLAFIVVGIPLGMVAGVFIGWLLVRPIRTQPGGPSA